MASGLYSLASAYRALFADQYCIAGSRELARTRAPPKVKFFAWLALMGRVWTNERRHRHQLESDDTCSFCAQQLETIHHLLLHCPFSKEVWFKLLRRAGRQHLALNIAANDNCEFTDWWTHSRKQLLKTIRKGFDTLILLVSWELWKERNRRVFQGVSMQPNALVGRVADEFSVWMLAGYRSLNSFHGIVH